jgi:hypothetical protein
LLPVLHTLSANPHRSRRFKRIMAHRRAPYVATTTPGTSADGATLGRLGRIAPRPETWLQIENEIAASEGHGYSGCFAKAVIWSYINNCSGLNEMGFAVSALAQPIFRDVGATIPT